MSVAGSNTLYSDGDFIEFIEKVFGEFQISNQNVQVLCPKCSIEKGSHYFKKKLAIKLGSEHLVHCWVCGYRSRNILQLIEGYFPEYANEYVRNYLGSDYLAFYEQDDAQGLQAKEAHAQGSQGPPSALQLPEGFELLANTTKSARYADSLKSYLVEKRGIPREDLEKELWYWKFGFTSFENEEYRSRIIIPSFSSDGDLNFFTARALGKSWPKYKNPSIPRERVIFNEINIDWNQPLTLVEGPFDLIKCGENATCLLGSELSYDYKLARKIILHQTPVILALDDDAWKKTVNIARNLFAMNVQVKIAEIPRGRGDIGDMSKSQVEDIIGSSVHYSEEYVLRKKVSRIVQS